MKVLIDNQLPQALARFLESKGVESRHVLDVGLSQAHDREIWAYAAANGMVLISKDEDFFHLAGQGGPVAGLIWVRAGNCRKDELLSIFDRMWARIEACLEAGDRIIEVR